MTSLYLTSGAADAEVTAGSGTKWKATFAAGASATHLNRNSTAAANPPIQMTDGATAGTDGTVVAWYTEPLAAVSITGAITVSIWDRENANANNVAPTIRIERCDGTGAVLSTIVSETVNHGAGEMATTAGGVSDAISVTAGNVTDTTLTDGDRLRITLWIDDASDQGGTGSMASGGRGEMWVNGPVGSQGQAQITFTEDVGPVPPDPTGQVDYVDSTTTGATAFASSRNVPMPTNTTMDVVVVEISRWNDPAINPTITNGGGFVQVSSATTPDGKQRLERFVKRLSAPMTSNVTFTWTGSMWTTADATCYRGVDRDVDLSTLFTEQSAAGVTTFPSVSSSGSVAAGSALHWHGTQENSGTSGGPTSPAGMTLAEDTDADQVAYLDNVAAASYTVSGAVPGVTTNVIASLMALPPEPAAGGVTGTIAVTQASDTSTASGQLGYSGSSARTQAANTSSAAGTVINPVTGTSAASQANQTASASGTVTGSGVSGTVAVTQAVNTSTASGQLGYSGSASPQQASNTSSAVGKLGYSGSVARTQANQTASTAGQLGYTGTATPSQAAQTASASGNFTAGGSFAGTIAVTQVNQTSAASGNLGYSGTVARTQASHTSTAAGTVVNPTTGSAAVTQANQTASASGVLRYTGTVAVSQASNIAAIQGIFFIPITGTVTATQANQTANASASALGATVSRPNAGTTSRPGSGVVPRPFAGVTDRP